MSVENIEIAASIPQAAKKFGLDSFCLYELIQREIVRPKRKRFGNLVVLQIEMDRVLKKPGCSSNGEMKAR